MLSAPRSVLVFFLGTRVPSEAGRQAEDAGSPTGVAGVGGWWAQRQGQQSGPGRCSHTFLLLEALTVSSGRFCSLFTRPQCGHGAGLGFALLGVSGL